MTVTWQRTKSDTSPAHFLQPLKGRRYEALAFGVLGGRVHEYADAARALAPLPASCERPRLLRSLLSGWMKSRLL
jgi:hypothetical protein